MALTSDLEQRQQDEVDSIASIYGDIFRNLTGKELVWNRKPSPHFQVDLISNEDPDHPELSLTLDIEFTKTYPTSSPIVKIIHAKNILGSKVEQLNLLIHQLLQEYPEQEICYILISEVKDALDECQRNTQKVLSLEEEREQRLKQKQEKLLEYEEAQERELRLEQAKQSAELNAQIQKIQGEYRSVSRDNLEIVEEEMGSDLPANISDYTVFDNDLTGTVESIRLKFSFKAVKTKSQYKGRDLFSSIASQHIVTPHLNASTREKVTSKGIKIEYVLSEVELRGPFWLKEEGKREIQNLEGELDSLTGKIHPNILTLVGYQIKKMSNQGWKIHLLVEHPISSISLDEVLERQSNIDFAVSRAWLIQLLPALETLHNTGHTFKFINPLSVLLCDSDGSNSDTRDPQQVRLVYPSYGYTLMSMVNRNPKPPFQADYSFLTLDMPTEWLAPELQKQSKGYQRKTDVWDLGILFMKIMIGSKTIEELYHGPQEFIQAVNNSEIQDDREYADDVYEMLSKMIQAKLSKRPSILEVNAVKFLRDGPVLQIDIRFKNGRFIVDGKGTYVPYGDIEDDSKNTPTTHDLENETLQKGPIGRYERDFEEIGRLGKGGFGEVVKVRNRMEGTFYAIKKIKHKTHKLDSLLSEVLSLARLNHQYIVRYYGTWVEELQENDNVESDTHHSDLDVSDGDFEDNIIKSSTSFLGTTDNSFQVDFISNSFDPQITFGTLDTDDDDDDVNFEFGSRSDLEEEEEVSTPNNIQTHKRRQSYVKLTSMSMLYIQMEFCENNTLLNLIEQGLPNNSSEYWRLFRQLLEAVSYIHREGFIHRDLKPMNIFIDKANNIKVGDFGLAKNSQFSSVLSTNNQVTSSGDRDLSTVVGTLFYNAKEVATGYYNEKVDMYSLGIIFFEMCYNLGTGMERARKINNLRLVTIEFPKDFPDSKYRLEKKIIRTLLDHEPKKRPGASELLQSGWMPVEHQDQVIKEALKSLADPASPWQQQVRQTLFDQPYSHARDLMFDDPHQRKSKQQIEYTMGDYLLFYNMIEVITAIFKKHGAIEEFNSDLLIPKSPTYSREAVFEVLDRSGGVLHLPYDLLLPFARFLSRNTITVPKLFRHNFVFRQNLRGIGAPEKFSVLSFDIVSNDIINCHMNDAECLKLMDEIICSFQCFNIKGSNCAIFVNHYDILDAVLSFAFGNIGIDDKTKLGIMESLSQLGVDRGPEEIKKYLRDEFKVPQTVTNDLIDTFNFTIDIEKAGNKLQKLLKDSPLMLRVERSIKYLMNVTNLAKNLRITTKIYFNPLCNYNCKYYTGGIMFQSLFKVDKVRTYTRIATGGRYDNLIKDLSNTGLSKRTRNLGVGFSLSSTYLFLLLKNFEKKITVDKNKKWKKGRCDVLVTSLNRDLLGDCGLEVVGDFWNSGVSADIYLASSQEDYLDKADFEGIPWVVIIRQSTTANKKSKKSNANYKSLRIRDMERNKDTDIDVEGAVKYLKEAIDSRRQEETDGESPNEDVAPNDSNEFILGDSPLFSVEINQKPVVVSNEAPRGRKNKTNKWEQENDSIIASANFMKTLANAVVISIDVSDDTLDVIQSTSMSSQDLWIRKMYASGSNITRTFAVNIYNTLMKEKMKGSRWVLLHSGKTNNTVVVDLNR
ncbi:eukaryotic translation initiation factor 2-alpha kinase [Yamadazyma tenuis]|uniref:non-specific serine/threonine protein kinase n=1 Tax=Candida tenuis (strain ATCC 10573 / BCRC 21748 / CBS 615 / JCM 9827 / NBRC 10315 / NRRL Y-1498 / VKM Y-70) TaxID=590646 RepID=G3BBJ0_CANTC|nr:Serine/threonine-protein kinase [Yamadazyma tenuis ATCC 10573]EGV61551.1 Serine/threonine-protein kinase [Yamadazyma tenuis ATCC 10573]WEJ92772.1 eukaryotic translation initiation factor 2-alpha kinase [Yamadazyma tenuis]